LSSKTQNLPSLFGRSFLSVQSSSMQGDKKDNFNKGDLIIIADVKDAKELKVGEIITFKTIIKGREELNSHRITEILGEGDSIKFVTMGDNNLKEDDIPVVPGEIVGKYLSHVGNAGKVMDFFNSKWGFFGFLVVPLILFFIWRLIKLILVAREYKKASDAEKELESAENNGEIVISSNAPASSEPPNDASLQKQAEELHCKNRPRSCKNRLNC